MWNNLLYIWGILATGIVSHSLLRDDVAVSAL